MHIVGEAMHCTGAQALDLPLVLGNHAIALYYDSKDKPWRFVGEGVIEV